MHETVRVLLAGHGPLAERAAALLQGARGVEARHVPDVAQAAALLASGGWDAGVADWDAGLDLARAGGSAPVLLLADDVDDAREAAGRAAGAADVIAADELSPALLRRAARYAAREVRAFRVAGGDGRDTRTVLGSLPGMAYRCHNEPRWTLEFASAGAEAITGYRPEELVGNARVAYGDLVHPDDRAQLWHSVQAAVRRDAVFEVEYRLLRRDGKECWVTEQGRPVLDGEGQVRLEGYVFEVTQRKAVEQALRAGEAQFRAVFEEAPIGMALLDMAGYMVRTNATFQEMLGYSEEELARTIFSAVTHPDDLETDWELFGDLVAADIAHYQVPKRYVRRDGSVVSGMLSMSLIRGADGAPHYAIGMVENVSERREAEEALRLREREFRSLLEHGRDVISIVDRDGDLRFTSPAVERVLGYGRTELAGTYLGELVHPDDVPTMLDLFERAIAEPGRPKLAELRVRHRNGSWRMLETVSTSLIDEPAVGGIVVNSRDVTERREAEEALRRSEQQLLQVQKMEAVGRLAGGVAHDFNNLLTAIRGNAELLLADIPPDSQSREDVEEIRRAADRAAALTRQLLAFSRRQVLQPRLLDLNQSVSEMQRMLRRLLGEDVELATRLDPHLRRVRADPAQVEQVIMNLVVNARDAMPDGGVVMLCTVNMELGPELRKKYAYVVPGEYVLLEVGDTGHGMDVATLEMAFEPFFTTKPTGKGTGLGLSMVYGIVKQSGGYVWIDSEPGRGTRVRVYLPVARGSEEDEDLPAVPLARARGRGTVLLVEDEETVRRIAERVLTRGGYDVLTAAEGAEAMALSRQHSGTIQVLVTDLVMPRMNGSDLARRLMAERPGIRVLFISGYDRDAARTAGPLEPGTDFIEKPFSPELLLERVGRLLETSIYPVEGSA
ncbi:PAS domain S-box protein [Longimicrobium sp.]|uniref:PAS domain S-box protein n=1 Tax=Longimicrobium sp. TaxID=2029185 RepID=UPI002E345A62|nr:PAS domain S-box protein [Longimicrobium sp.]HEX6040204.1 PAS domain S-box protein [Longimicrobium sp.]